MRKSKWCSGHKACPYLSPNTMNHEKRNRDANGGSSWGRVIVVVIAANVH